MMKASREGFNFKKILECGKFKESLLLQKSRSRWIKERDCNTKLFHSINEFHRHGVLPRGTNLSFLDLIAKCDNTQSLDHFRPISLVGCLYKVLAKILANRMKNVLDKVIDPS